MNNEFNELSKDINMPNIQVNKLNKQTINIIDTFLKNVNFNPLNNERLVFDNNIVGIYQGKFKKNAREIIFDARNYRRAQFKELFERLLLGLLYPVNYSDSWYIKYYIKGENEPRYQILSPLKEANLEEYIDTYLNNETEALAGSYFFFDAIPAEIERIKGIDNINIVD
jgi:hypothetical protein